MIETTKDILWLVVSFCILWLTIFICWTIYYIATILREAKKIVQDVRKKIELVEAVLKAAKEKLSQTSSYLRLIVNGVETAVEFMKDRKDEQKKKKDKK